MKGNKKIIIAVILVLLLILNISIIYFINNNNKKNNNGNTTTTTQDVTKTITIKFETNGGEKLNDYVGSGGKIELPSTVKEGYTFIGWYLEDNTTLVDNNYFFKNDTQLYAKWEKIESEAKTMKITFDSKGGSEVKTINLECDNLITLPKNPTRDGYTFRTWEDKHGTPILSGAMLACEDVTLYAVWDKDEANDNITN